jgi:hypothetical protein
LPELRPTSLADSSQDETEILMKRRIRIAGATLLVATGLTAAVAAQASAKPPFKPAEKLCTAQGGSFSPTGGAYTCAQTSGFSEDQLKQARTLCEKTYGGVFHPFILDGTAYGCQFVGV